MFDTHCHLNFSAFRKDLEEVIESANKVGVTHIIVPGTDLETSKRAVEIGNNFKNVYAAVGIHPHHIFELMSQILSRTSLPPVLTSLRAVGSPSVRATWLIKQIEKLLHHKKVVAIGEVGVDRYYYQKTKHENYKADEKFINLQKEFLKEQIDLAINYKKSLILHNREAKDDLLEIIGEPAVAKALAGKAVFHCCEPDEDLLNFAKEHKIFIGVDGDITYRKDKQEFIKKIPLDLLVLETDSPLLLPEPLRAKKQYPNKPENMKIIVEFIAKQTSTPINRLIEVTDNNSKKLFKLDNLKSRRD